MAPKVMIFPTLIWELEEALTLVRNLQPTCANLGYHIALGGGVLNAGWSTKDVDLYFLPLDTNGVDDPLDTSNLMAILNLRWGVSTPIGRPNYPPNRIYRLRETFVDSEGRRIDAFIV